LYWLASKPKELGKVTALRLAKTETLWFSSISLAELEIKHGSNKLPPPSSVYELLASEGMGELGFRVNHSVEIRRFGSLNGHDPFDRLMLAQAAAEDFAFITADEELLSLNFPWILDARL
jgi:PIN domain nuclease of toxin-antitoxin system